MKNKLTKLGAEIKKKAKEMGMTLYYLAKVVHIRSDYLSQFMHGRRILPDHRIWHIKSLLGIKERR